MEAEPGRLIIRRLRRENRFSVFIVFSFSPKALRYCPQDTNSIYNFSFIVYGSRGKAGLGLSVLWGVYLILLEPVKFDIG